MPAPAVSAQAPEPMSSAPEKPRYPVGQLTSTELAREASRLEAALRKPFAESVKVLLRARLDAVRGEQAERRRKREEDTAAAKAELAAREDGG